MIQVVSARHHITHFTSTEYHSYSERKDEQTSIQFGRVALQAVSYYSTSPSSGDLFRFPEEFVLIVCGHRPMTLQQQEN